MLIHDRFIFLHLQKTGGTYLAKALREELPKGSLRSGAPGTLHPGWDDIPPEARDRPVLFYVRNPWDWYVSYYHHLLDRQPDNGLFQIALAGGRNDFGTALRLGLRELRDFSPKSTDPYTARFLEFAGSGLDSERLTIGRFESIFDDLERFLQGAGVELSAESAARIRAGKPVNASSTRGNYRDYYDDELRDLVGESSRMLIERFGYRY